MISVNEEVHTCRGSLMMGKVLWHTMVSLDGFIAGPDDDMQWVFGSTATKPDSR